jgi:hypothetical protein
MATIPGQPELFVSRWWPSWRNALILFKPQTVVAWHRKVFRLFWAYKSRRRRGRPSVNAEIRALVRQMAQANVGWGAPRVHGELLKLAFLVSQATVSGYMPKRRRPPSQTWRTFLDNHMGCLASIDFFVVPTATFGLSRRRQFYCHGGNRTPAIRAVGGVKVIGRNHHEKRTAN